MAIKNLSSHQLEIIHVLTFKSEAGFTEINTKELSSDKFNYHLKTLLAQELIEKTETGKYRLTNSGKEYSGKTDIFTQKLEKQN